MIIRELENKDIEQIKDLLVELQQYVIEIDKYNLNIIPAEFEDFPTVANGTYDIVLLSNVKDYVTRWKGDDLFYRVAAKLYKKNLNPGGVMELQTSVSFFHDIKDTELVRFANKLNAKKRKLLNAGLYGQTDVFLIEKPKIMEMQETM